MIRSTLMFLVLGAAPMFGGNVRLLASLPGGAVSRALQLDLAGNIYVAGVLAPQTPKSPNDTEDAFVAKLSPDGSTILYLTVLGGSRDDLATALVVGPDGSAYVTGYTSSPDFPLTPGALQATVGSGFLAKLSTAGMLVYSSFVNCGATGGTGMALDREGNLFLSGPGDSCFPATSGSLLGPLGGFILKLDSTISKPLLSINGYGGLITLDRQGNIFIAGTASAGPSFAGNPLPSLPAGAFQSTHTSEFCQQSSGPSGFASDCLYQYVAKMDPTGANLLWATYLTGTYGATPVGIAVDSSDNVILAGTTNSDDYPVTSGSFQTAYSATAPPPPNLGFPSVSPPPAIGFVTKLNATGSRLLWSTYFGGTFADHITGMSIGASGNIYLSGRAGSSDLPGLSATPLGCRPSANQVLGFVAKMASDGATAGESQLVYGVPACLYSFCNSTVEGLSFTGWPLALRSDETGVIGGVNGVVANVDLSVSSRLACIADPADGAQLSAVAPGELVSIFGADLAPVTPSTPEGGVAASSDSFGVFFNGIAAPILYSSAEQVNVQVPYEISGQNTVQMQVVNSGLPLLLSESRTLRVVQRQPSVFISPTVSRSSFPSFSVCRGVATFGTATTALNEDGTLNDCANPASAGSVVTIFVNGLGPVTPAQVTGIIAPAPAMDISPGIGANAVFQGRIIATTTAPGAVTGVARVQLQLPPKVGTAVLINPSLGNSPLRDQLILVWTQPN